MVVPTLGYPPTVTPTVFREGPFRAFFFSREEERMHVHVRSPDGETKFWMEPEVALAHSYGMSEKDQGRVLKMVLAHEQEIRDAWHKHFRR